MIKLPDMLSPPASQPSPRRSQNLIRKSGWAILLFITALMIMPARSPLYGGEKSEEKRIREINRMIEEKGYHWIAGKTSVSDLSREESDRLRGYIPPPDELVRDIPVYAPTDKLALPDQFDWRSLGATTEARNQGGCGSCWAFAGVGQLESHALIYDGRSMDLSEQQCMDCNSYGADCGGGWAVAAYEVFQDPGSAREICIPYQAADGFPCTQDQCQVQARIDGFFSVKNNVDTLKQCIYDYGPVYTSMYAHDNLNYYTSGCYDYDANTTPNHAVLIVGWDDTKCSGEGAWIVKNSWGTDWGIDGYGYIKYGVCKIGSHSYQISYVQSPVLVEVQQPDGGEELPVGSEYDINWITDRETPDSMSIMLSLNGGESYDSTVVTGLTGVNSYTWTVPNLPVTTARIKVLAWLDGDTGGYDTSNHNFTIKGKPYRYVSPTGGDIPPYSLPRWAASSIQDAVGAAVEGDTVMVEGNYTYNTSLDIDTPVYLMGGWNPDFTLREPDVYTATINGGGSVVAFLNVSGFCGIEGFTITNGAGDYLPLPENGTFGGGILAYNASPTIKNNVITGCGVADPGNLSGGGGIACYNGDITIENNRITGCSGQIGGGIYLYQSIATVRNNSITENSANSEFTGMKAGGGVCCRNSSAGLEGNLISSNSGYVDGGGIYSDAGAITLAGDTITSHHSEGSGGGIYSLHSRLEIRGAVIRDNSSASTGGGIYHKADSLSITNSIIDFNQTYIFGGGIYGDSLRGDITNNTINDNSSSFGGGNIYTSGTVSLEVRNNMFTFGGKTGFQASSGDNLIFRYNNCYGNSDGDVTGFTPDSTNIFRNPGYADTASAAPDYHLLVHSGGIDTGDPAGGSDPDGSRADMGVYGGPLAEMAAPSRVEGLTAAAENDTTIGLEWTAKPPAEIQYYAVYGDTSDGFAPSESLLIATVEPDQNSYLHHPCWGCWYYRVSAVDFDGYGGGYSDQSGACASAPDLIPPSVSLVSPNGGEFYETGDTISIRWIATDNVRVDSVSLYYSGNGGEEFHQIGFNQPNDSLFRWIAPSMLSDSCLIKVTGYDPSLLTASDQSDSMFAIKDFTAIDDPDQPPDPTPAPVTALHQNYPNPFNGTTTIEYSVQDQCLVTMHIYDPAGRLIKTLYRGDKEAGRYSLTWKGKDNRGNMVSSGVYFIRFKAGKYSRTRKTIYLR